MIQVTERKLFKPCKKSYLMLQVVLTATAFLIISLTCRRAGYPGPLIAVPLTRQPSKESDRDQCGRPSINCTTLGAPCPDAEQASVALPAHDSNAGIESDTYRRLMILLYSRPLANFIIHPFRGIHTFLLQTSSACQSHPLVGASFLEGVMQCFHHALWANATSQLVYVTQERKRIKIHVSYIRPLRKLFLWARQNRDAKVFPGLVEKDN